MGVRLVGEPGALVSLEQRGLRLVARPVDPAVRVRILLRPEAAHNATRASNVSEFGATETLDAI